MTERWRERVLLLLLLLICSAVFLTGINWGLPSTRVDPFLFGDRTDWWGQQIGRLIGERDGERLGADVDRNPAPRGAIINATDEQRAEIARRYRLYTFQPDENITLMALASMKPRARNFDPKLYQYGGLWIYPVGAAIKVLLRPTNLTHYLWNPHDFGKFYVVARLYTVAWGLIGAWAVFRIARNSGGGLIGAGCATVLYAFLPVVVNMSHEAKPHLPGAVLTLLAALAAGKFVDSGRTRWWILCGALCGAAMGMILTGAVAFAIIPAMVLMRPMPWLRRIDIAICAVMIGICVYCISNPYVAVHLVKGRALLQSNLGNTSAMYQLGSVGQGFVNAIKLMSEGTTIVTALAGLIGAIYLLKKTARLQAATLRMLMIVAAIVVIQFIALAAGKPGEYGRFAILPDTVLALCAAVMIGRAEFRPFEKVEIIALLVLLTLLPSVIYLRGFVRDSGEFPRRLEDAQLLAELNREGASTLAVFDEPAPYLLPPVDLFKWKIVLLPRGFDIASGQAPADVIVRPVDKLRAQPKELGAYRQVSRQRFDDLFPSRISWAGKPMEVWVRSDKSQ